MGEERRMRRASSEKGGFLSKRSIALRVVQIE
jgi:hypothetical protein